ncbi:uncharacterized protein LOC121304118 isoform X2 [Polyodon spathula]|uniref:uncharacterized protein LOC121304118 isoform X2 n=1 Tax=Polyodon spathula TaxID=7913 RepID=UPI001B7E25D3|nr:uncharacterized protein LOC121304118 isoform X2 [Polyodon spathula]
MAVKDRVNPALWGNPYDVKHPTTETGILEEDISGIKTPVQESGSEGVHRVSVELEMKVIQDEMDRSTPSQPLARTAVHSGEEDSGEEDSGEAPSSPDSIADPQLEYPAQEGHPALDTALTPSEEDVGAPTPGSGDVPAVSWSLDQGLVPTADSDDKKKEKKEKNHLQKKSKAKKMKKNKPSPAKASSDLGWDITKVLRPWWLIVVLIVILLGVHSADATNTPSLVCIGQTAALEFNKQGPVKGPCTVYKGNLRNAKLVYKNEIVSDCPPKPYVLPGDQSYLFCKADNRTALLLVLNVTLEHNSKFTVEFITQNGSSGFMETSLQVNSTDTNTASNPSASILIILFSVFGVWSLFAILVAAYCFCKRRSNRNQENIELGEVASSGSDERDQPPVTGNGYQPVARRDTAGSPEDRPAAD